jgi:C4-dicarboxylate transporter DctM subunit
MEDIVRGSLPFVLLLMLGLAVVMVFPILATWLPGKMGF